MTIKINPVSQVGLAQSILSDKKTSIEVLKIMEEGEFTDISPMACFDLKGSEILDSVLSKQEGAKDYLKEISQFALIGLYDKDFALRNRQFVSSFFDSCEIAGIHIEEYFSHKDMYEAYVRQFKEQKVPYFENNSMTIGDLVWAYRNTPELDY